MTMPCSDSMNKIIIPRASKMSSIAFLDPEVEQNKLHNHNFYRWWSIKLTNFLVVELFKEGVGVESVDESRARVPRTVSS